MTKSQEEAEGDSRMNYTKGKWEVQISGAEYRVVINRPFTTIARVGGGEEDKINAHLMAAAPQLYEACKAFIRHIELHNSSDHPKANMFCTECPRYHKEIEAAISAAEGEK